MEKDYAVEYRTLYQNHWWWRGREEEILRRLESLWGDSNGKQILDVGCGDGLLFDKLQRFGSVTGVEADENTLTANGKWRDQIVCSPFDSSFQPGRCYDAILMLDILEHMPDPDEALRHAKSLLAPNGVLLATVPAFMSLWTSHDDLNHHEIRYTKKTFLPLFESAGLVSQESTYLFHWTCPAKLLIRLKEVLVGAVPRPPQIPARWMNQLFLWLTRLEQATVSRWRMPFGSSLLVLAGRD